MDENVHLFPSSVTDDTANTREVTTMSFEQDVMQASMTAPVVVFLWAPLCPTCKQLMPILEKAVKDSGGVINLAKVNVEQNPELGQVLQLQTVPTVLAFYQGQPVDGFMGAKSENEVKALIDKLVQIANGDDPQAIAMAEQIDAFLEKADKVLAEGDWQTAMARYMQILETIPDNVDAVAGLIRSQVAGGHIDEAKAFLERFIEQTLELPVKIKPLRVLLALIDETPDKHSEEMEEPKILQDYYELAMALFKEGKYDQAVFSMLEIIRKDREWEKGRAKAQLLRIFEALGSKHDVTLSGRKQLSSILFS